MSLPGPSIRARFRAHFRLTAAGFAAEARRHQGADGLSAIAMIKAEIGAENYNDRVEKDRWRILGEGREADAAIHAGPGRGHKTDTDSIRFNGQASVGYIIARLKRDAPDIADQLARGEFKSAAAAARAAGFKIDPSPISQLRRWWKRAPEGERAAFLAEIDPMKMKGRTLR